MEVRRSRVGESEGKFGEEGEVIPEDELDPLLL